MASNQTVVTKNVANKKISITREFNASQEQVWRAYTEHELLDQWWAPKPWKAVTKSMDFREGGYWLYAMVGPENEQHWARVDYTVIQAPTSFEGQDNFCDEAGTPNPEFASTHWRNSFAPTATGTQVTSELTFETEEDMQKLLEMGFEEGMKMAIENLVEIFSRK